MTIASSMIHQGAGGVGGGSTMMRSASYAILAETLNYSPQSIVVTASARPSMTQDEQEEEQDGTVTTLTNVVVGVGVPQLVPSSSVSSQKEHPSQICGTSLFSETGMKEEEVNTFRSLIYSSSSEEEEFSPDRSRRQEEEWHQEQQQQLLLLSPHQHDDDRVHFIPLERMLAMPSCKDLDELDSTPSEEEENVLWNHNTLLLHHSNNVLDSSSSSFQLTPKSVYSSSMQEGSSSRTRSNTSTNAEPFTSLFNATSPHPQGTSSSMLSLSSVSCSGSAEYFFDPDELDYVINHHD